MTSQERLQFSTPASKAGLEEGTIFTPRFDDKGLIVCVTTEADTGAVLMVAYMNEEALRLTIETGVAHYWSRSRKSLWRKGDTSGQVQTVTEIRTDCDQDAVWIRVEQIGAACHTGRRSCFYRKVEAEDGGARLVFVDADRLFDPDAMYKK